MAVRQNTTLRSASDETEAILERLQREIESLPNALARIAKYIIENPEKVLRQSVAELCEFSGSGEASIVRLCRHVGFSGFRDFKLALAAELGRHPVPAHSAQGDVNVDVGLRSLHDAIVQTLGTAYKRSDPAGLVAVADALSGARRIDLFGAGVSGIIAELLAYRLLRFGLTAQAFRDRNMAHEVASGLGPDCVAIGLSESGLTAETVQFLKAARSTGAGTIAITNRAKSPVGEAAHMSLQAASVPGRTIGGAISSAPGKIFVIESIMLNLARIRAERGG